jgi:dihydroflavonol-4-reductase
MRIVITGGRGFIGGAVVRRLVGRGDTVVAIVRDPDVAADLAELGVELRRADLTRTMAIVDAMRGTDAVIHLAGAYRVGIPASERPAMHDTNVGATNRVLDAAATANLERVVHVSTVNVFGNTRGRIVDERYRRDLADGFLSFYDETKFLAHRAVEERIAGGAPVVIVMPGVTYGPRDHSGAGQQLEGAYRGTIRYQVLTETGISAVFVDDVAAGIVAALDRGRIGEAYILAGENTRLGDAMAVAARLGGHRLPRLTMPTALLRVGSLAPEPLARAAGLPDDLGEVLRSALGVTFWASSAKAAAELGYTPRDLASGLRAAFGGG